MFEVCTVALLSCLLDALLGHKCTQWANLFSSRALSLFKPNGDAPCAIPPFLFVHRQRLNSETVLSFSTVWPRRILNWFFLTCWMFLLSGPFRISLADWRTNPRPFGTQAAEDTYIILILVRCCFYCNGQWMWLVECFCGLVASVSDEFGWLKGEPPGTFWHPSSSQQKKIKVD